MKRCLYLGICVILVSIGALAFAGMNMDKQTEGNKERIAQMGSLDEKARMELLGELSKERSDVQSNLIYQLDNSRSKEVKFAAAFLLGFYRMEKSVYHLSRHITLENERVIASSKLPLWDRYPVVEALIRIGKPAVPEMLRTIETSEEEKVRDFSARVIRYVEGSEIGRIVIEKAMEKQTDPAKKARLKTALKYLK